MSPSHNPQTGLFYVTAREQCDTYYSAPQIYKEGRLYFNRRIAARLGIEDHPPLAQLVP